MFSLKRPRLPHDLLNWTIATQNTYFIFLCRDNHVCVGVCVEGGREKERERDFIMAIVSKQMADMDFEPCSHTQSDTHPDLQKLCTQHKHVFTPVGLISSNVKALQYVL